MSKIIIALDYEQQSEALAFVDQLDPTRARLKVGKTLFTRFGPSFVTTLIAQGFEVFLDLKFHDIPQQVHDACRAAADLGVWMLNVHASGGLAMMQAAKAALVDYDQPPILIGVTLLTSLSQQDLAQIGIHTTPLQQVMLLANLTKQAGLDGVVCSAQEASSLKQALGKDFLLVTPGIRLSSTSTDDQQRIVLPKQAIANGADYLVIGRPITQAAEPQTVLNALIQEIA